MNNNEFGSMLIGIAVGVGVSAIFFIILFSVETNEYKSPHRLEPIRTEIVCDSIKCDTTYVYLKP